MPVSRLKYDPEADALYIYLHEEIAFHHTPSDIERTCVVNYGTNGVPISVEFWNVHRGLRSRRCAGARDGDTVAGEASFQRVCVIAGSLAEERGVGCAAI